MPFFLFLLCTLAFFCLAMAMERQQETWLGHIRTRAYAVGMRCVGVLSLAVVLVLLISAKGAGVALVIFSGYITLGAAFVFVLLLAVDRTATAKSLRARYQK